MKKVTGLFLLMLLLILTGATTARADVHPGVRGGVYVEAGGVFLGGELLMNLGPRWFFNPNVEYAWGDKHNVGTFNFDFHYDLPTASSFYYWVGGGPAVVITDFKNPLRDNQTDIGLNLFMGIGFNKGGHITPYIQPKVLISDHSDFVLTFGVRF